MTGGRPGPARRRYYRRMITFLVLYGAIMGLIFWARGQGYVPQGPVRYLVALAPALPICGVIWAILRFVVEEEDEYLRHLHIQGVLVATGATLCICTAWGFLASFAGVKTPDMMYVFVIFNAALIVGEALIAWRQR